MTERKFRLRKFAYLIMLSLGLISSGLYVYFCKDVSSASVSVVGAVPLLLCIAPLFAYAFIRSVSPKNVLPTISYITQFLLLLAFAYSYFFRILRVAPNVLSIVFIIFTLTLVASGVLFLAAAIKKNRRYGAKGFVTIASVIAAVGYICCATAYRFSVCYYVRIAFGAFDSLCFIAPIMFYAAILLMSLSNGFIAPEEQLSYNEEVQRQKIDYDAEIQALIAARTRGEIGPEEYERRRVEILNKLQ